MKSEKRTSFLIAVVLAFLLSFGGAGCLVTGFGLEGVNMTALALLCCLFALAGTYGAGRKWGNRMIYGFLALELAVFCCSAAAREQFRVLVCHIGEIYHRAYGWEWLQPGEYNPQNAGGLLYPLGFLAGLAAMLASWTVIRREDVVPAVVAALLPLLLCLVATDTVPWEGYLYQLLLGLLLMIFTAGHRQNSEQQGNSLALLAAIPIALALGLLFLATPRESYVNKVREFYDGILTWAEQYPGLMEKLKLDEISGGDREDPQVDLRDTGPLNQREYPVMDVVAPFTGTMYLRGRDYDVYDGTGWTATPERAEFLNGNEEILESRGAVTISTLREQEFFYIPYYSVSGNSLMGGIEKNTQGTTAYGYALKTLPDNWKQRMRTISADWAMAGVHSNYLSLPEDTRIWAEELLKSFLPQGITVAVDKADIIANYVCGSAEYNTNTPKMPEKQKDFARWFLMEGESGYCVHFASAAAVLLRAAGVPARYVTGYMFQAEKGVPVTVRADKAHAWVEYYEARLGMWLVLEATPSMPDAPEATIPTQPQESLDTTENTLPGTQENTLPQSDPSEVPQDTESQDGEGPEREEQMPDWLKTLGSLLLWLGLALAAVWGQRQLRLMLRKRKAGTGNRNRRGLARWRELELLYRRLGKKPPEELLCLAQKARFSQHELTGQELQALEAGLRTARELSLEKPWYQRLLDQYIFAAY